jgi:hypothetical protein
MVLARTFITTQVVPGDLTYSSNLAHIPRRDFWSVTVDSGISRTCVQSTCLFFFRKNRLSQSCFGFARIKAPKVSIGLIRQQALAIASLLCSDQSAQSLQRPDSPAGSCNRVSFFLGSKSRKSPKSRSAAECVGNAKATVNTASFRVIQRGRRIGLPGDMPRAPTHGPRPKGAARCRLDFFLGIGTKAADSDHRSQASVPLIHSNPVSPFHGEPLHLEDVDHEIV